MKKILLLGVILSFCATGCYAQTDTTLYGIIDALKVSQRGLPELTQITAGEEDFAEWISDYYMLDAGQISDGIICYAEGIEAVEFAVLYLTDETYSNAVMKSLNTYITNRAGVFEGYALRQAAMVKQGIVAGNGRYIALIICPEQQTAKKVFLNYYNEDAVLSAFRTGNISSLSETNRKILEAAKKVIASTITNNMTDYEKELAIHDYITHWSRFDYSVFNRSSQITDGSDTPYGVLINRSAMCHGYSSTFQLFMNMLGIECITVFGKPNMNGVRHSWNMVRLGGEWYCVDCAWDDPIGGTPGHTYFNVTSSYLRRGSIHRWDEDSVPEATGTAYAYNR